VHLVQLVVSVLHLACILLRLLKLCSQFLQQS
jgi:hypothetical protein